MTSGVYPDLKDRVVIVTGGSHGIGEACVHALLEEGAIVAIFDIDECAGNRVADSGGGRAVFFRTDVSHANSVRNAVGELVANVGTPSALVNNAGIQHYGSVVDTSEEDWDRVINTNLKSAYLCAKYVIPLMQTQGGGVIINVASIQSFHSQANVAPYTTSKSAMLGLTRSIAIDFAPTVRCIAICPGTVDTPMLHNAIQQSPHPEEVLQECQEMHLMKRIAAPSEVANLILYLLSDKSSFITGQSFRIDGGLGVSIGGSKRGD